MTRAKLQSRIAILEAEVASLRVQLDPLHSEKYLRIQAGRGSRKAFSRALAKVPARKPMKGDKFPVSRNVAKAPHDSPNRWLESIAGSFANDKHFKKATWYGRQWRQSHIDLPPSPALTRLRRDYNDLIRKLRKLARFKSNRAAAEYAHREFNH